ncbi:hypothetical protein FCM35_KLT02586 [Carex littledalei]|uniref:Uncharacterized protein n=1 Tax=Carex littledalei TaxID=544730 RepID=A0A833R0I9_9POAL|nr:hypothetical protein FCM35_KLT02586 [Carex littledalei]
MGQQPPQLHKQIQSRAWRYHWLDSPQDPRENTSDLWMSENRAWATLEHSSFVSWRRPVVSVSTESCTKFWFEMVSLMEFIALVWPSGSTKRSLLPGPSKDRPVEVNLNPDGFYQVRVEYAHCTGIASGCGLKPTDVLETVAQDNHERAAHVTQEQQAWHDNEEHMEEEPPVRFDPYTTTSWTPIWSDLVKPRKHANVFRGKLSTSQGGCMISWKRSYTMLNSWVTRRSLSIFLRQLSSGEVMIVMTVYGPSQDDKKQLFLLER